MANCIRIATINYKSNRLMALTHTCTFKCKELDPSPSVSRYFTIIGYRSIDDQCYYYYNFGVTSVWMAAIDKEEDKLAMTRSRHILMQSTVEESLQMDCDQISKRAMTITV